VRTEAHRRHAPIRRPFHDILRSLLEVPSGFYRRKQRKKKEATMKTSTPKASGGFMKNFMALNIINFTDMAKRENHEVSWNVTRVSSP